MNIRSVVYADPRQAVPGTHVHIPASKQVTNIYNLQGLGIEAFVLQASLTGKRMPHEKKKKKRKLIAVVEQIQN